LNLQKLLILEYLCSSFLAHSLSNWPIICVERLDVSASICLIYIFHNNVQSLAIVKKVKNLIEVGKKVWQNIHMHIIQFLDRGVVRTRQTENCNI